MRGLTDAYRAEADDLWEAQDELLEQKIQSDLRITSYQDTISRAIKYLEDGRHALAMSTLKYADVVADDFVSRIGREGP